MMPGCSKDGKPVELAFPFTLDTTAVRCPAPDPTIRNEWRRKTARPETWREKGVTAGELQDHIAALELAEARKNGYGAMQLREYERCRQGRPPAPKAKGPPTS